MSEPNFSVNFTARMLASEACSVGDCLVYDHALLFDDGTPGVWRVASSANRTTADARAGAVALTSYGGGVVGKVAYQSSGMLATEVSGLGATTAHTYQLVRVSTAGRLERIASYTAGDDVVGYAMPDGRVALHIGLPWDQIVALAGGGGFTAGGDLTGTNISQTVAKIQGVAISGTPTAGQVIKASSGTAASWQADATATSAGVTGDIQATGAGGTFAVLGNWKAIDNLGKLRATYWDNADGTTIRAGIEVSWGTFNGAEVFPDFGLIRLGSGFLTTGGWSLVTISNSAGTSEWGLMGMSGGNFFLGDTSVTIPTTIFGNGISIGGGSAGTNVTGTGGLKVNGVPVTTGGGPAGSSGQLQTNNGSSGFAAPGPYAGASYVSIISGTPTSNGYRMGNGHILAGRNVAGSADLHICYVDSSNNIILGDNQAGQGATYVMAPSQIYLSIGGALSFGITSTAITTLVAKVTQTAVSATDIVTDTAQVNTTNATGTTIYTVPIANNAVTAIDIRITACQSTSASADVWRGSATFKNAAGTVATVEGANITHGGSTSWGGVGFSISGTNVLITVTGAASTTIEWGLSINYQVTRQS